MFCLLTGVPCPTTIHSQHSSRAVIQNHRLCHSCAQSPASVPPFTPCKSPSPSSAPCLLTPSPMLLPHAPFAPIPWTSFAVPVLHLLPGMFLPQTCAWLITPSPPSILVSNVSFSKRLDVITLL